MAGRAIRSNADITGGIARQIRALGRRVGMADPDDLRTLLGLQAVLDAAAQEAVDGMRANKWTWRGIAEATDTTRENACMRWGKKGQEPT